MTRCARVSREASTALTSPRRRLKFKTIAVSNSMAHIPSARADLHVEASAAPVCAATANGAVAARS